MSYKGRQPFPIFDTVFTLAARQCFSVAGGGDDEGLAKAHLLLVSSDSLELLYTRAETVVCMSVCMYVCIILSPRLYFF